MQYVRAKPNWHPNTSKDSIYDLHKTLTYHPSKKPNAGTKDSIQRITPQ